MKWNQKWGAERTLSKACGVNNTHHISVKPLQKTSDAFQTLICRRGGRKVFPLGTDRQLPFHKSSTSVHLTPAILSLIHTYDFQIDWCAVCRMELSAPLCFPLRAFSSLVSDKLFSGTIVCFKGVCTFLSMYPRIKIPLFSIFLHWFQPSQTCGLLCHEKWNDVNRDCVSRRKGSKETELCLPLGLHLAVQ